jgi:hypothetical protein
MGLPGRWRVRRTRQGDFEIKLGDSERALLRSLPGQLREIFDSGDPSLRRLFPEAYADNETLQAEYEHMVGDDLRTGHLAALMTLESTADAERLNEEQMLAWARAINELRLVLGTRLDVTEDMDSHPDGEGFAVYTYLGFLQEQVVQALSA